MSEPLYQTWASDSDKEKVYDSTILDGYDGVVYRSQAHGYGGYDGTYRSKLI